jgi:oligopeptide/dipeptide ABC transporter ATP-binding protein
LVEALSDRLVQMSGLTITYSPEGSRQVRAVREVTLGVRPGEVVGILGESGSGKSTLASALLRLLPATAHYDAGSILFRGRDLLSLSERELRTIRGKEIALVSQDPALTLNPVMRVGDQIAEVIRAHEDLNSRERRERVYKLLGELGFEQPQQIYVAYPHQLSGGQRQRIAIAQAIACRPALVIADEPTSKLDVSLQAEIITLLSEIRRRYGTALLVISHDPNIFAGFADRIAIMYAGRIVEEGNTKDIFRKPLHPYTQALVRLCTQRFIDAAANRTRLSAIEGEAADLTCAGIGCPFEPRCPVRMPVCTSVDPRELMPEPSHSVSCFKYGN